MYKLLWLFIFLPMTLFGQNSKVDSIWMPLKFFIGEWTGQGEGESGIGEYERSYEWLFKFNSNYIEIHNITTYAPSTKNPKGEIHEDASFFSYDKARKIFVLRQFYMEGLVNQYRLDSISPDGKTLIFLTETSENFPVGWKAKGTYTILSQDAFEEIFELAAPNKNFELFSRANFVRRNNL